MYNRLEIIIEFMLYEIHSNYYVILITLTK